jgi:trimeric autotransporter adhesin
MKSFLVSNYGCRAILFLGALALTSCGGSSSTSTTAVAKIIVQPSVVSIHVGSTQKFTATALNADGNAVSGTVTWSSSATDVATVDESTGIATAKAGGTAKITATVTGGSVASDPATLTVMPQIASVSLSPINSTIKVGEQQQFVATAKDASGNDVTSAVFQWNISYSGIATIGTNGLATGVSPGTVFVTASTDGVSSPVATLNVTN